MKNNNLVKKTNILSEMEWAIITGDVAGVETKLDSGFNPNEVGNRGFTTLSFVILQDAIEPKKRIQMVGLLLNSGADPRVKSPANGCDSFEEISQKQRVFEDLINANVKEAAEIESDERVFQGLDKEFLKSQAVAQRSAKASGVRNLESEVLKGLSESTKLLELNKKSYEIILSSSLKRIESLKKIEGESSTGIESRPSSISSRASFSSSLSRSPSSASL